MIDTEPVSPGRLVSTVPKVRVFAGPVGPVIIAVSTVSQIPLPIKIQVRPFAVNVSFNEGLFGKSILAMDLFYHTFSYSLVTVTYPVAALVPIQE